MANIPETSNSFVESIQNLPDFVQKLTADSITPGRMSVLTDNYGSMTSGASSASEVLSMASGSGLMLPVTVVPTPVLETITVKTEPVHMEDTCTPKLKIGKSGLDIEERC